MSEHGQTPGEIFRRGIKSFVIRQGRMTKGQQRAYDLLWPRYGVPFTPEPLDLAQLFGNTNPVWLEIGFGMGHSLAEMAENRPQENFLGIEVHKPGVGALLMEVEKRGLTNVRVSNHSAVEVLQKQIPPKSLDGVMVFFPDPWHKKRHHKRRLIQPPFVELLINRMKLGALLHLATDWEDYAQQMLEVCEGFETLENVAGPNQYQPRPDWRPLTKFEQRGQRLGHGIWDLLYRVR